MAKTQSQVELAQWACAEAVKAGASEARVRVSRSRFVSLAYRERKIESLEESVTSGMNVDLYLDGRYSSNETSDLRPEALQTFLRETVAMTRYLAPDPHRRLPEPRYYENRASADLDQVDGRYGEITPEERHRLARAVEEAALQAGGDRVLSVTATYYDQTSESATVASNGFSGSERSTDFWCSANVTAKDEGDRRPEDGWWAGGRYRDVVPDPALIGTRAVERALARVGSQKLPTETMAVIIENRAAGRLLRFMGQGLTGRNLQQRSSYLEGKVGEQIASPHFSTWDDPLIPRGLSSRLFDAEGISARRMPIIEKGVLRNYYIDTYYGRKLGMEPTTGSPSNIVFATGERSQAEWMKTLGRGVLITGFLGGNSNSSTGDFSTGVQGFLFEGGEIAKPVSELNLAGNHLEFWKRLVGVGNDPFPYSSTRVPCLVFEGVALAGA